MRWVKFIKHVYEIHFKCKKKINAEVHMVHNQASHLHSLKWQKKKNTHLIWDKHFLSPLSLWTFSL